MDLHVIPECYIDTKLIKALVPPSTRYNHQKGCSKVTKLMKEQLSDEFALGIVDRDKKDLGYASEFDLVYEIEGNLELFKHRQKHHYLIFICPAIEKWLINAADEVTISLNSFDLPHNFKALANITKTSTSENNDTHSSKFQALFNELKQRQPVSIAVLSFWIEYLKTNNYTADLEYLKLQTELICNS